MKGIFLDIESNGLSSVKHHVIEIAFRIIDLESKKSLCTYTSLVKPPLGAWEKSDPISLEVNGFTLDMLKNAPSEHKVSQEIVELFKKYQVHRDSSVYICQNPSFDRAFFSTLIPSELQEQFKWPYHWLDLASMFWALQIKKYQTFQGPAPWECGISKNKIAQYLGLPNEKEPHKALQGVDHLIECYFHLHARH